ncbi:hypothetical protein GALMADRAFT_209162 [Galerina marginata CBS 339.88]|uniref:Uncharacterized protein n=1 Tax=Galerina marginata (strain CBS 339.88) TaxID=685588 RepID=A0A067TFS8_GALM3|nr:hypothetical protein GALMADRAFT_209162 [Galerina marginata CBS 339.88]
MFNWRTTFSSFTQVSWSSLSREPRSEEKLQRSTELDISSPLISRSFIYGQMDYLFAALHTTTMMAYTVGLYPLYSNQLALTSQASARRTRSKSGFEHILDVHLSGAFTGYDEWNQTTARMASIWKVAQKGCTVLLPLSLAFFQASRTPTARKSIDFWVFFTLPVSSLVWSILFSIATVCIVTWKDSSTVDSTWVNVGGWFTIEVKFILLEQRGGVLRGALLFEQQGRASAMESLVSCKVVSSTKSEHG